MKMQPITRTMVVGAVTLSLILLAAALLVATRSMEVTLAAIGGSDTSVSSLAVARVLVPQSTAAYNGVVTPSQKVYAPWLLGGTSVLRVYNAGEASADVQATFSYTGASALIDLDAGSVAEIEATGIPTGTQYAAILTATQPIVVVVNDFGPIGQYATSYSAIPDGVGKQFLALPDIFFAAPGGWGSDLAVQNVGAATATVTVVYTKTNEPLVTTNWVDDSIPELAAGETYFFDPGEAKVPEKFVGVATVKADQPVVVVVRNSAADIGTAHPDKAFVYRVPLPGSTSGDGRSLFFPLLVNAFEDWRNSEIQIFNAGPTGVDFMLEVGDLVSQKTVAGWSVDSYSQDEAGSQSPLGQAVAGRVEDARTLQSLVWLNGQGRFIGDFLAAYSAPSAGAKTWYFPYTDQSDTYETLVAVQNLGDVTVNVSLTYHSVTGTVGVFFDAILGSEMAVYSGGDGLPSDFVGGITVEADQPVTAVALIAGRLVLDKEIFLPVLLRNH